MDFGRISRCAREILISVDTIRQIKGHEILIGTTATNIETNLNIIINEIAKLTKRKLYFDTLSSFCEKFTNCRHCPLSNYKEEFTNKCKSDHFVTDSKYSTDELIEAYNFCKKYWEDMFSD